jgi:GNAT superfamily N-acetyltransferase
VIHVRVGGTADREAVARFYVQEGYTVALADTERYVLAEDDGRLVGVVRQSDDGDFTILRTMHVMAAQRGKGIGQRMLASFEPLALARDCYCLPYAGLVDFYGRIGFALVVHSAAPPKLQRRVAGYQAAGLDVVLMQRPAGPR